MCCRLFIFTTTVFSNIAISPIYMCMCIRIYGCMYICRLRMFKKYFSFKNGKSTFYSTMPISNKIVVFWYITQMYSTHWILERLKIQSTVYFDYSFKSPCVWADVCYFCQAIKRYWYSWVLHLIQKMNKSGCQDL